MKNVIGYSNSIGSHIDDILAIHICVTWNIIYMPSISHIYDKGYCSDYIQNMSFIRT